MSERLDELRRRARERRERFPDVDTVPDEPPSAEDLAWREAFRVLQWETTAWREGPGHV